MGRMSTRKERLVIFNFVEKRVLALAHIAEGAAIFFLGGRAPSLTYNYTLRKAKQRAERF